MYVEDFLKVAEQRKHNYPAERAGQVYMNALWYFDPDIHNEIYGTEGDCFYDDRRIPVFMNMVVDAIYKKHSDHGDWPAMVRSIWPDGEQV